MRAEDGDDDGVLSLAPVVSVTPDGPKNGAEDVQPSAPVEVSDPTVGLRH
jgi:hypothetical protein